MLRVLQTGGKSVHCNCQPNLWWVIDYPYHDRAVRAFFAGGNGGQIVMGVPELDLVIAFFGGNYSDPVLFVPQREFVPKYILPAVNR